MILGSRTCTTSGLAVKTRSPGGRKAIRRRTGSDDPSEWVKLPIKAPLELSDVSCGARVTRMPHR